MLNLSKVVILGSLLILKNNFNQIQDLKMIKIILFIKEPFQNVFFRC